jgi:hypothetical protein
MEEIIVKTNLVLKKRKCKDSIWEKLYLSGDYYDSQGVLIVLSVLL